jgi:hypothetical protein
VSSRAIVRRAPAPAWRAAGFTARTHCSCRCSRAPGGFPHLVSSPLGLTADAGQHVNNPITVVINASANTRHVDYVLYHYHVRLYGDRR